MKYLYKIKEQTFTRESGEDKETEKIVLIGTDREKAISEVDRIFRENKPEDLKTIVDDIDSMIAEKYDEKTGNLYQYMVSIETERLDF